MDRRAFLDTIAAASAACAGFAVPAAGRAQDPKRLQLGLIGCGWYGMVDVRAAFQAGGVEVLALCDVDRDHLEQSAAEVEKLQGRRPQTFKRYEELLRTPGLEAVILATPPHWHALPFIAACRQGLHIYCEKPLAYDIRECRAMVDAAAKSKGVVQIGFQRRHAGGFRQVREYLAGGPAGRIVSVDAQIHYTAGIKDATPQPPPAALDWELWCGPAPRIPYSPQVGHMNWRLEKTTGHGHLVDWGIHLIDAARFILGEGAPRSVTATGGIYFLQGKITTPDVLTAHFEFERCPLTWRHRIWGAEEFAPEVSNGLFFYGEQETVFVTDDRWIVIPRGKGKERKVNPVKTDAGRLHMADFLEAVRSGKRPACVPEDAYHSTAAVKLAMISYETGSKVSWDSRGERILGNPQASRLLKRPYRAPWKHPYSG